MCAELGALLNEGKNFLSGLPDGDLDAEILLEEACGVTSVQLLAEPDLLISKEQEEQYRRFLNLRKDRVPTAYITRHAGFMGLDFFVNQNVLIPEQDTETLVETALEEIKRGTKRPLRILDLCTGSGCILLSVLWYLRRSGWDAVGIGTDLSEEALAVAKINRERLHLESRARLLPGDLFAALGEGVDPCDVLLSNPPYIRESVIRTLAPEVGTHEPHLALSGGEDGLVFYRRIAAEAGRYCRPGALVLLEIGYDQGGDASALFQDAGFTDLRVIKDLGGNDRVLLCRSPKQPADGAKPLRGTD